MTKAKKFKSPFAAIFDMDGVVVDNIPYHFKAWQAFCRRHGLRALIAQQFYKRFNGRLNQDILPALFGKAMSSARIRFLAEEKENLYLALYRAHRKPLAGLLALLRKLKRHKIPVALATAAPAGNVKFVLSGIGAKAYFAVIIDATFVKRGKPHPEIFLKAAKALGMPPQSCVVFEDALLGILAAKRAGMKTVGVATSHSAKALLGADLVVRNFSGLTSARLEKLFKKI